MRPIGDEACTRNEEYTAKRRAVRKALIHLQGKHEARNNDDAPTEAKHSGEQPGTNAEGHQD